MQLPLGLGARGVLYDVVVGLVERDEPLTELLDLLSAAEAGRGSVVLVRGEAGIGKTALVRAFTERMADRASVLWGGCDDLLTARPLGPLRDIAATDRELAEALDSGDRDDAFECALELLRRPSSATVMVVEDLHWADDATLDLIRFLGRRVEPTHGLLVLTCRDGESPGEERLRRVLGDLRRGVVVHVELATLTRAGVEALLGDSADPDQVLHLTGGNPLFVTEVAASGDDGVPPSVSDAVAARVGRLSAAAQRLIEAVSVFPGRVELDVVARLLGDAGDAADECERGKLLEIDGQWLRFRHELTRRAVEAALPELRRRDRNREALAVLEALGADPARCAHHARVAGDAEPMLRLLPPAARQAAVQGSVGEAVAHWRALAPLAERMDDSALRDYYEERAYAEHLADQPAALSLVKEAVALRRAVGDAPALGRCLTKAATITRSSGEHRLARDLITEAISVLDGVPGEDRVAAHAAAANLAILDRDFPSAIRDSRRALELSEGESSRSRVHALGNLGRSLGATEFPQGLDLLDQAFQLAGELGMLDEQIKVAGHTGIVYASQRDFLTSDHWVDTALGLADRVDVPAFDHWLRLGPAFQGEWRGRWDEATERASELAQIESVGIWVRLDCDLIVTRIAARRGEPGGEDELWALWRRAAELDDLHVRMVVGIVLAELAWVEGSCEPDHLDRLRAVADEAWDSVPQLAVWDVGELSQALWLAGAVDPPVDRLPPPYRHLVEGDWRRAADAWHQRGVPYLEAIALTQGDVDGRLRALEILDGLGAAPVATKLRGELANEGVRVPRGPQRARRDSAFGLTRRQTEVLELLVDGLSNAEIAERLFLSVRTVEQHVSAILRALGASDRAEAARLAAERVSTASSTTG